MPELMTRGFLTVDELTQPMRSFQQGYAFGSGVMKDMRAAKAQRDFDKIAQLEFETIQNAANQGGQPAATPDGTQPLPAPTPAQPAAATPAAPQSAPVEQPAAVPTGAVSRPAVPTAGAAPQPPAAAPTPASVVPEQAPAPNPAAAVEQQVRTAPVLGNSINTMSDKVFTGRVQGVQKMVQEGKISAASGKAYIETITAARDARIKSAIDLADKMSLIEQRSEEGTDKRIARAATIRKEQDNQFGQVYEVLREHGPEVAQQYARELGMDIDLSKTKDLVTLQSRAKRSEFYTSRLDQQKKEADLEQGTMSASDIPPGWSRRGATWIKPNGERASGAEVEAAIAADQANRFKRARASGTTVNVGQESAMGKGLGEMDAKMVEQVNSELTSSKDKFSQYKQINEIATKNPKMLAGPGGGIKAFAARVLGTSDEKQVDLFARDLLKQTQANLELSEARANKGQGAITDSERAIMRRAAAGDNNFTAKEWEMYSRAMMKVEQLKQKKLNTHIDTLQKRNPKFDLSSYKQDVSSDPLVDSAETPAEAAGVVSSSTAIASKYGKYAVGK